MLSHLTTYNIEVEDSNDDDGMENIEPLFPDGTESDTTFSGCDGALQRRIVTSWTDSEIPMLMSMALGIEDYIYLGYPAYRYWVEFILQSYFLIVMELLFLQFLRIG